MARCGRPPTCGGALDAAPRTRCAASTSPAAWPGWQERTEGKHARGTNVIPFSMHNIDEMLDEVG